MKPESRFITAIRDLLSLSVYVLKLNLPYARGVADCRYEGEAGSAWVEYKWYSRVPRKFNMVTGKNPKISRLQNDWLEDRWHTHTPGQAVAVIVGHPGGGVIIDHPAYWQGDWTREIFLEQTRTNKEIAAWIEANTISG